jgi:transposase
MSLVTVNGQDIESYRIRTSIWNLDLTAIVYLSPKLRQGQIRGIKQTLSKQVKELSQLKNTLTNPTKRGRKRIRKNIEKKIETLVSHHLPDGLIGWTLEHLKQDAYDLDFWIDEEQLNYLKEHWFGRRILITNRHHWSTEEIIRAYWGQAYVENAFKLMKNPFHAALRPQFHWTDQKIEVHGFICVLALLLQMIAFNRAKTRMNFKHSPHTLIEKLSSIRLSTFIEQVPKKGKGRYKVHYCLEEMDQDVKELAEAFDLNDQKLKSNIPFSVYN